MDLNKIFPRNEALIIEEAINEEKRTKYLLIYSSERS